MGTSLFDSTNQRYLLSVSDEPKQLLQPISGYAREPLVSLEEACESLIDIVPNLMVYVWIAKKNSQHPDDDLTEDESAAIRLYTMEWDSNTDESHSSLYSHLNRTLKSINRRKLRPWFRYLKLFLTALAKLPVAPRQTVWRGVRKNHSADYPPGAEITWWAFSSCTTSLNVLESDLYLGKVGTRTLFSIETINARTIRSHSHFITEDEILLLPGSYFEVKSLLNPAPDLLIVHLQQQVPPHCLLEPPYEGAELIPSTVIERIPYNTRNSVYTDFHEETEQDKKPSCYKRNSVRFGLLFGLVATIITIILAAVLGTRTRTATTSVSLTTTASSFESFYNQTPPLPVSVADAFYSFDENTLDLYNIRRMEIIGNVVNYAQGYVGYGKAICINQSIPTYLKISPTFLFMINFDLTIEGYFKFTKMQDNVTLIQIGSELILNVVENRLAVSTELSGTIRGITNLVLNIWQHFALISNGALKTVKLYINGQSEIVGYFNKPVLSKPPDNSSTIIAKNFYGCIDQLSFTLRSKSETNVLWNAGTIGYYSFDSELSEDNGPNGQNASSSNAIKIVGWQNSAIMFNSSNAYYRISSLAALGLPNVPFTIAFWIRIGKQMGSFLTIANSYTCLLSMGVDINENKLVVYLPNATITGTNVNMIGPHLMSDTWTHVALTWSPRNGAKLYTSSTLQVSNQGAIVLNNARNEKNSSPMTVTFGRYNGAINCDTNQGINRNQTFFGSFDEIFLFSYEMNETQLKEISTKP